MPLPATRVIHRNWQTRHRPVAESTMTVGVEVTRAGTGEGTYNPATGQTDPPARIDVAACPARVQARAASDRVVQTGDQTITFRGYLVTLPVDAGDLRVDDRVEVTSVDSDEDDPQLLGLDLRVIDVMYGSLVWERDLICEDDLG